MQNPSHSTLNHNPTNSKSAPPRDMLPLTRKASAAALVAALAATTLVAALASSPASTQNPPTLLSATGCTDGTFVDTSTYPVVDGANNDLVDDCQALVAIQNHFAATGFGAWRDGRKINRWSGVRVTSGRVSSLNLRSDDLTGSIPAEIGNLTNLTDLNLRSNNLTGSIPAEIGNLTNLRDLNLRTNDLTGSIPTEIGNLTNLTDIDLSHNDLTGSIPAEIGNLTNLTSLDLYHNDLTGSIPAELGNLTNLTKLQLNSNELTGSIPAELGNLTNLTNLELQNNNLTGSIPTQLGSLTPSQGGKLRTFDFCRNNLEEPIPEAFRPGLNSAGCIYKSRRDPSTPTTTRPARTPSTPTSTPSTPTTSTTTTTTTRAPIPFIPIPVLSSANCSNGTFVDTSTYPIVAGPNNDLVGDCLALVAMQNHWAINANAMGQSGEPSGHHLRASEYFLRNWGTTAQKIDTWEGITVTSGRVSSLQLGGYYILDGFIHGNIPAEIGNLTNLTDLSLVGNDLTGSIPAELGNLTNLTTLWLAGNDLTGSIPAELGNLTNLTTLWLAQNRLTGSIPAKLGNLTNLTTLRLSRNKLTGSIPPELGNLTNLTTLRLARNQLTGSIPPELGNLTNLTYLDLEQNRLSGIIPTELGSLALSQGGQLAYFYFCYNPLSGPLSETMPKAFRSGVKLYRGYEYEAEFDEWCLNSGPFVDVEDNLYDVGAEEPDSEPEDGTTTTTTTTTTSTTTTAVPDGDERGGPVWNTLTIERTGITPSQIRQTLGLASNQAIYAWNTQTQTWQRLTNPNQPIPADTMLTFLTEQAISQANLEKLNLARGTQQTTLTTGWNIISIPEAITRNTDDTNFLLADELTNCDTNTAVIAIANYSTQTQQWQIWLPCNPASQARLTTGANPPYRPLTAIAPADTTYIYSRSAQTITWNTNTQTYQTSTN